MTEADEAYYEQVLKEREDLLHAMEVSHSGFSFFLFFLSLSFFSPLDTARLTCETPGAGPPD